MYLREFFTGWHSVHETISWKLRRYWGFGFHLSLVQIGFQFGPWVWSLWYDEDIIFE